MLGRKINFKSYIIRAVVFEEIERWEHRFIFYRNLPPSFLILEIQVEIQQVSVLFQFSRIILRNVKGRATFIIKISFNIYFLHYELLRKF